MANCIVATSIDSTDMKRKKMKKKKISLDNVWIYFEYNQQL